MLMLTLLCQYLVHLDLIILGHCFLSMVEQAASADTVRLAYIVH